MVASHTTRPLRLPGVAPDVPTVEEASESRLVNITFALTLLNLLGILTVPFAPIPDTAWGWTVFQAGMAAMGVLSFVYFTVFALLHRRRPQAAKAVLFGAWAITGTGIALLHRPDLGSPAQASALLVLSTAFFAFAASTTLVLERWSRARWYLLLYGVCFVAGHLAVAWTAYSGMESHLFGYSTSMTALIFLGMVWALRRMTLDVDQSLDQARMHAIELEHARDAAFVANHTKTRFLTNMSHELRTPLNAILGYVELVREDLKDLAAEHDDSEIFGRVDDDLERVHSSGSHLLGLINAILDLSRIEAGRMEAVYERVAVEPLVTDLVDQVHPLVRIRDNTIVVEIAPDAALGSFRTDPTKLRQILLNLLSNAAKFTEGGQVSLRVHREPGTPDAPPALVFTVSDTGRGIPSERLEAIFEPFEQAASDTHIRFGGTGLGLPLARRLTLLLEGQLTVDSTEGRGSVFRVRLPISPNDPSAPHPTSSARRTA